MMDDPLIQALQSLPEDTPSEARASQTRDRCLRALHSRHHRRLPRLLAAAATAAACAYLAGVFLQAARLLIRN